MFTQLSVRGVHSSASPTRRWLLTAPALAAALCVCLVLLGAPAPSHAIQAVGEIVVNSDVDTVADDGFCTLREAIIAANTDTASGTTTGECAAGMLGADSITFADDYTITLGSQLTVTSAMTITGHGPDKTIIQASTCNPVTLPGGCIPATYRVIEVTTTGNLTLDGATVRHGNANDSGGIRN